MANITIYCGDDLVSSRKAFLEYLESLKDGEFEIERINGKELTEEQLELYSSPCSLFGQKRCLAIEGLLSLPKSKEKDKLVSKMARGIDYDVVVWEGKEFSKAEQQKFKENFVFKNFKLPEVLFSFLERLFPSRVKENMCLFHQAVESVDPSFIFLMIIRHVRLLLLTQEKETEGLPSWQVGKLCRQEKLFSREKLIAIYQKLLAIDFRQKTSQSAFSLSSELDLLLTEI